MLSKEFKAAIYLNELQAYKIAMRAGIEPSLFSKWMKGMRQPDKDDRRLDKVARIIGYSGKIFEENK
jgi:transposase-like protein